MAFGGYLSSAFYINILAGILLALFVFFAHCAICQNLSEKSVKNFSLAIFSQNILAFLLITATAILVIYLLFLKYSYGIEFIAAAIFSYALLLLSAIDFKTQMLPDLITKPLIALGIIQGFLGIFTDFFSSVFGAITGYMILWSVNFCYRQLRGIDGMGYGDFKLLAAIGAWVGIKLLPLVILTSSISGIVVAMMIIKLTKADFKTPTPFGPSLVMAGFVALLYGNEIISWYLGLL